MRVTKAQALRVGKRLGIDFEVCDLEEFRRGIQVESEHRALIGDSMLAWGRVAHDHLMEVPTYYSLLKKYVEK